MDLFDPAMPDRFWDKVQPEPNSGCWIWLGATVRGGYPHVWLNGRNILAHRWIKGFPPLEEDHKCNMPCCVNPAHLETVTHAENMHRMFKRHKHH